MADLVYNRYKYILFLSLLAFASCFGQNTGKGRISGKVNIDSTWTTTVFLSYLPSYNDIYNMSREMIIAEAEIDQKGNFEIDLSVTPKKDKLYRLHIPKKSDSRYSLMIGRNENYLLLIANKNSNIEFYSNSTDYPFDNVIFEPNTVNHKFHQITELVYKRDSIASESDYYKRKFIRDKAKEELLKIADSTSHALVSLYAIFKSDFESDYNKNKIYYESYLEKWTEEDNDYITDLRTKISKQEPVRNMTLIVLTYLTVLILGFIIGRIFPKLGDNISKLSVQERKVFEMLKTGATNKEISEEFNIGISTVKSHVSSILSKMNVKSRKELMS